jgi:uncharacterized protein YdhG (YjbR/CyaY superfamily)
MSPKPATIDDYFARLPVARRAALQSLRRTIRAAAPQAEEGWSYGLPAFLQGGKAFVGYSASANHLTLFPMNGHSVAAHARELRGYESSKGAIRFTPEKPLPQAFVKRLVKERLAEVAGPAQEDPGVAAFLRALRHPLKKEIEAVRRAIRGASPAVREGIKWNAPSFRTREWFATMFLRSKSGVEVVFHRGARVKDNSTSAPGIADPLGMLRWPAADRCVARVSTGKEFRRYLQGLARIVRDWIRQM